MKTFSLTLLLSAAAVLCSEPALTQSTPIPAAATPRGPHVPAIKPASVARGEKVFVEYCSVCHGLYGKGDGPRYAFFSEEQYIPDLTDSGFLEGRDEELISNIRDGLRRLDEPMVVMPQFKYILSDSDIRSTLEYVKSLPTHPKNSK